MSTLAKTAEVVRNHGKFRLLVDGEEFPWYIAENGVSIEPGAINVLTIQLLVDGDVAIREEGEE